MHLNPRWILGSIVLTSSWRCVWPLQCSALQDITTTPAHTAASAVPLAPIRGSLARTTASPVQETQPQISTAPPTSCSAKVRFPRPPPPRIDAAIKLQSIQRKRGVWRACVPLHRSAVRGRTGRFHRVHRVPQLPGELPSQCGVHLDHQPATQTQDPYCCSGNLLAHRGWVWGLLSNEKKL